MMRGLVLLAGVLCSAALMAAETSPPVGTLIDFSVEASQVAGNDLARASVFAESADASANAVAQQVNAALAKALAIAKTYPMIKARSGSTWTTPNYGKNGRSIETWRMRSELLLETRDVAALSELLGKLQSIVAVGQIGLAPAPETRRKAETEATREAMAAFQDKAAQLAALLGKRYRIKQLNIGGSGPTPMYAMAGRSAMAQAAPMPIEAGDTTVSVSISGQIELLE